LDTALKVKDALKSLGEASETAAGGTGGTVPGDFAAKIVGDWILENSRGSVLYPIRIEREEDGVVRMVMNGGGTVFAGDYKLEGTKLVKAVKPGDPGFDMTWHYAAGHLKLKAGPKSAFNDWVLRRK
jgi:hypothetical protein